MILRASLTHAAFVVATVVAATNTVAAQTPDSSAAKRRPRTDTLGAVVVTGYRFLDKDVSGITSLPLPIQRVPQSVSLVNNDFAKAADLKNMSEVAQYTPGALWASYNPSDANELWLRGFPANYAIDGLTVGYQVTDPDHATLERYELVKGPASVVYGAQSPGGIVNLVSKSESRTTPNYLEVLGGSWGRWRVEGQANGALNQSRTIRGLVTGAEEDGGSFINFVKLRRSVAYGGLDFLDLKHNLSSYIRAGYQRTENTPFNGLPTFADGTQLPVPRSFFIGSSTLRNVTQVPHVNAGMTWQPSELWSFDVKGLYHHIDHAGGNVYNYGLVASDETFPMVARSFSSGTSTTTRSALRRHAG